MNPVWKCTVCEFGPCYVQCDRRNAPGSIFGDGDDGQPLHCPMSSEETPEFEIVAPEANPWSIRWIDQMQEWLMGDGYYDAPEKIRDGIAIDLHCKIEKYEAMRIIDLLRDYEDDMRSGFCDREEWTKKMAKVSKWDILNAVFPEAFKAGVIYGELVRQKKTETE